MSSSDSGERGIRTLGKAMPYNGFRVRLLRPLGHLSKGKKEGATQVALWAPLSLRDQEDSNLRPSVPQTDALSS